MKKKKAAFTLVEMIISIALTVVVLGLIYNIFITGNKVFSDSDVKTTLQMEAKDIQEAVSNIGMQASELIEVNYFDQTTNVNKIFLKSFKDDTGKVFLLEHKKDDENKQKFQISTITLQENKDNVITKQGLEKQNGKYMYDRNDVRIYSENIDHMEILSVNGENKENQKIDKTILNEMNSMKIKIVLKEKKGFADVEYPFEFTVTFRNKR